MAWGQATGHRGDSGRSRQGLEVKCSEPEDRVISRSGGDFGMVVLRGLGTRSLGIACLDDDGGQSFFSFALLCRSVAAGASCKRSLCLRLECCGVLLACPW